MVRPREKNAVSAKALEVLILCANRTNEVFGAKWNEFDLGKRVWTIPSERAKGGREHKIPLSDTAVNLVREMARQRRSDFIFSGEAGGTLSTSVLVMLLWRMGVKTVDGRKATPHGFRATFKTWASEVSQFPSELVEVALAHKVGNATEQAYQRGELLGKRRRRMEAWSSYCAKQSAKVLPMVPPQKASRRA
jgi:integrase